MLHCALQALAKRRSVTRTSTEPIEEYAMPALTARETTVAKGSTTDSTIVDAAHLDVQATVRELFDGSGAVTVRGLFSPAEIAQAREVVMRESESSAPKVTHFQGEAGKAGTIDRQRRVWNLLAKGEVFSRMAAHPLLMQVMRAFLGSGFTMGSIAANRILPGGPGQEPHIDYPYWDYHAPLTHPARINASFPLNAQATIMLDPFTVETGATAYVPGSQRELHYPVDGDRFYERCERMLGEPGDTVIFFGAVWHCAMPNRSSQDRSAILIQYLPKWIKPMENLPAALPAEFIAQASPDMRQLLGLDFPYPEILDSARASNADGRLR
jgi:ectoine hydroxylase-related dioxygenase (phytanoyl-CoA dioxygenase family)